MGFLVETVLAVDRLFPRAALARRDSPEAYSEWEYETGRAVFTRHFGADRLRGQRVLDAACGPAGKTAWYAEAGAALVAGVDLDRAHLLQGRDFATTRGVADRVRFAAADAMRLPFRDSCFDAVIATDAMEHFGDPAAALHELARVARPGGTLFLTFPPFRSAWGAHLYDHLRIPWCQLLLPRRLLYAALERATLDAERRRDPAGAEARARESFRAAVDFYEHALNGMTVARFRDLVRREPRVRARRIVGVPPRGAALAPLARLPGLEELLSGLAVAELERVTAPA